MALLPSDAYYALLEIFLLLAFAEVLHSLTRKLGVPQIVADLLAGMILGAYALGGVLNSFAHVSLFVVNAYVSLFAAFSVVLLLFAAGLGSGFSSLRRSGRNAVFAAVFGDLASFGLAFAVLRAVYPMDAALLIAVATAATSAAVAAGLIRAEGIGERDAAKFFLNAAALDDVVALVLLSIVLTAVGGHSSIIAVTGSITLAVVAWVVLLVAAVVIVPRLFRLPRLRESQDLPFVVLFVLVAVVISLGFSAVVGAYVAGLAIAESLVAERTRGMTEVLVALFGSLFFVVIGAEFNVRFLLDPRLVALALLLGGIAFAGKFLGVYPFARRRLGPGPSARWVAIGMVPRGEIGLVVGAVGYEQGILTQEMLGAILLMAILTTLAGGFLFRREVRRAAVAPAPASAGSGPLSPP